MKDIPITSGGRVLSSDEVRKKMTEIIGEDAREITATKEDTAFLIHVKCNALADMLLEKNRKYGNSALEPCRIFSRANAVEQILVRIDDKLNRIKNRQNDEDEDVIMDLAGYLILLMIAREKETDRTDSDGPNGRMED